MLIKRNFVSIPQRNLEMKWKHEGGKRDVIRHSAAPHLGTVWVDPMTTRKWQLLALWRGIIPWQSFLFFSTPWHLFLFPKQFLTCKDPVTVNHRGSQTHSERPGGRAATHPSHLWIACKCRFHEKEPWASIRTHLLLLHRGFRNRVLDQHDFFKIKIKSKCNCFDAAAFLDLTQE